MYTNIYKQLIQIHFKSIFQSADPLLLTVDMPTCPDRMVALPEPKGFMSEYVMEVCNGDQEMLCNEDSRVVTKSEVVINYLRFVDSHT